MLENPELIHKWNHTHSILSICAFPTKNLLFAGTQDSKILVVDKKSYNIVKTIQLGNATGSALDPLSSSPPISNSITNTRSSVLCLDKSQDEKYLFSAGADSLVRVWSVEYCTKDHCLQIEEIATVYSITDIGDIFAIKYLDATQTLVFGCQNASLLYLDNIIDRINDSTTLPSNFTKFTSPSTQNIDDIDLLQTEENTINLSKQSQTNLDRLPHRRYDKFFDSKGPTGSSLQTPITFSPESLSRELSPLSICDGNYPHAILEIPAENIIRYAHNGFIYSIVQIVDAYTNLNSSDNVTTESIITGSGDGVNKIWNVVKNRKSGRVIIKLEDEDMDNDDGVISQTIEFPFLYCGLSDGMIKIWDLNTKQLVSTLVAPDSNDIASISVYNDYVFAITEKGITLFHQDQLIHWDPNQGKVLSSEIFVSHTSTSNKHNSNNTPYLVAGGNDGSLTLWDLSSVFQDLHLSGKLNRRMKHNIESNSLKVTIDTEEMLSSLKKMISFKTVSQSSTTECKMASARCATYLYDLFTQLGADNVKLLPVKDHHNNVILAHFNNQLKPEDTKTAKKILWYGHYDVVTTGDSERWDTDPFSLTCENGYLKGRGVSDNKGPLISAMYSVASLYQQNKLTNDIVFLIEGSEEIGSPGFEDVCRKFKSDIAGENIDWIFLSNSSWIDEEHPCINYGLRGVINAEITVKSDKSNGHSGINGGVYPEPTLDLVHILSKLQDDEGNIIIPEFIKSMKTPDEKEIERFTNVVESARLSNPACFKENDYSVDYLVKNWTTPSLSITSLNVSGPGNITVIPHSASAGVSIRLVPGQNVESVKKNLEAYLKKHFDTLRSSNELNITVVNEAEPWLGDPSNHAYQVLKEEVTKAWEMEPLFVREGGSIPSIRTLERCFDAPAIQIPCGQSSANAHLDNENLRIQNWTKMTEILSNVFNKL